MSDRITLSYEYKNTCVSKIVFESLLFFSHRAHQQDKQEGKDCCSYIHKKNPYVFHPYIASS